MTAKKRNRTIGRAVHTPRKPKPKRVKIEPSGFFDQVEGLSSPDAKVKKLIEEYREEQAKEKE